MLALYWSQLTLYFSFLLALSQINYLRDQVLVASATVIINFNLPSDISIVKSLHGKVKYLDCKTAKDQILKMIVGIHGRLYL